MLQSMSNDGPIIGTASESVQSYRYDDAGKGEGRSTELN